MRFQDDVAFALIAGAAILYLLFMVVTATMAFIADLVHPDLSKMPPTDNRLDALRHGADSMTTGGD